MKLKSNIYKSLLVVFAYLLVDALSSMKLIHTGDHVYSIAGAMAFALFPSDIVMSQFVKLSLLLVVTAVAISLIVGCRKLFEAWGVSRGLFKGVIVGLLCCLPMAICNLISGSIQFSWEAMFLYSIFPGIYEELVFRGFIFGILHRFCKWGFVWAALLAAVTFMLIHLYQSHDFASALMVFSVTAFGSMFYSWLYVEWDYNLWIPIAMHVIMNFVWILLPIDGADTAVGNLASNIGRAITIILAIVMTVWYKKRRGRKCFDYKLV